MAPQPFYEVVSSKFTRDPPPLQIQIYSFTRRDDENMSPALLDETGLRFSWKRCCCRSLFLIPNSLQKNKPSRVSNPQPHP